MLDPSKRKNGNLMLYNNLILKELVQLLLFAPLLPLLRAPILNDERSLPMGVDLGVFFI